MQEILNHQATCLADSMEKVKNLEARLVNHERQEVKEAHQDSGISVEVDQLSNVLTSPSLH